MKSLFSICIILLISTSCSKNSSENKISISGTWELTSGQSVPKYISYDIDGYFKLGYTLENLEKYTKMKYFLDGDVLSYEKPEVRQKEVILKVTSSELTLQLYQNVGGEKPIYKYKKVK